MKKFNIILLATAGLTLASCSDFLSREPLSDLAPGTFFQSKSEMANWNAGMYIAFQSALSQKQVLYGDVRSDNVQSTGYAQNWGLYNNITAQQGESSWQPFYQVITRANTGIEKYPSIPNVLESEVAPYMGQAYGLRAYMYFWGTRVWGRMPLITETWDGELSSVNVPRASLDDIEEQIYKDIEKAIEYFSIANSSGKFYMNLASMYELKAEADMWYHHYEDALVSTQYFVNNGTYKLVEGASNWKAIFENPGESSEVIFAMDWNFADNGGNSGWPGQLGANNTNNGWQIARKLFEEFLDRARADENKAEDDPNVYGCDDRFWNTVDTVRLFNNNSKVKLGYAAYTANGIQKCIKYAPEDPSSNSQKFAVLSTTDAEQKLVMMRVANPLLLRAEALNKLGRGSEALDIVNQIRSRVGYFKDAKTEVNVADKNAVENLILLERQLEFFGEGQRWFDLMRTDKLIEVMDPLYRERQSSAGVAETGFGDPGTKYWPIYYKEFESNSALKGDQNPPYAER